MPRRPDSNVDGLFKLPLGEFTSGRNALVAELKKAGRHAEANEAKTLTKPSVSAWAVNQLYWRHRESFDRLIEAGDRLRRAQTQPTGDAARNAATTRREALTALAGIAEVVLRESNYGASHDMLRRVTRTLEALSSYGSLPDAPVAGRLSDDLDAPGFEAVAGLLPGKHAARSRQLSMELAKPERAAPQRQPSQGNAAARREEEKRKTLRAAAKAAVREAERALNAARKQAERGAAKSAAAAIDAKESERQHAQLEKELARVSKNAAEAKERAREAAADASEANAAVAGAQRALELAQRRVQETAADG
jgi:hypothetical protein